MIRYSVWNSVDLMKDLSKNNYRSILKEIFPGCVYCDSTEGLTVDHVIPKSKGGSERINNLVIACRHCNLSKGDKDFDRWFEKQPTYDTKRMQVLLQWVLGDFWLDCG